MILTTSFSLSLIQFLFIFLYLSSIILDTDSSLIYDQDIIINHNISAINSDYFYLSIKNSTLPIDGVGLGVFAKANIPKGKIICEQRGPIISSEHFHLYLNHNKLFYSNDYNGTMYKIICNNICSYINDCTIALNRNYTVDEYKSINHEEYMTQCFDNYSYNARYHREQSKVFIISTRDIMQGEEIFFSYGW